MNNSSRLYYRAKEAALLLGLSLRTVYEGVYAGWIPSRKVGNSRLIPAAWLEASTDQEADRIGARVAEAQRLRQSDSPENRYSLDKSPRVLRGLLRLVRNAFSHQLRTSRSQCVQRAQPLAVCETQAYSDGHDACGRVIAHCFINASTR